MLFKGLPKISLTMAYHVLPDIIRRNISKDFHRSFSAKANVRNYMPLDFLYWIFQENYEWLIYFKDKAYHAWTDSILKKIVLKAFHTFFSTMGKAQNDILYEAQTLCLLHENDSCLPCHQPVHEDHVSSFTSHL